MTLIDVFRGVHIAAGGAALGSFWIPMVAPKGGRLHRRAGWVFVVGMAVVSVTAIAISGYRFVENGRPGARVAAVLLGYIGVLTGAGAYKGVRVLRTKNRTARTQNTWDLAAAGASALLGPPTAAYGIAHGAIIVASFGVLGTVAGLRGLRYWWRPPQEKMHWWFEHMADMTTTSIAAITAFLVLNAGRLGGGLGGRYALAVWLGPTVIGVPLLAVWEAYYRRRFAPKPAAAPAPAIVVGEAVTAPRS